jgi:hypothetical protein
LAGILGLGHRLKSLGLELCPLAGGRRAVLISGAVYLCPLVLAGSKTTFGCATFRGFRNVGGTAAGSMRFGFSLAK